MGVGTLTKTILVEPVLNDFTVSQYDNPDESTIQDTDYSFIHQMWRQDLAAVHGHGWWAARV